MPNTDKPDSFANYWLETLNELSGIPSAPQIEEVPLRSTEFATAYTVQLTSIGPYRIFGHLSIPNGTGPFPTRYYIPKYGSVVELIPQGAANALRQQYITFTIGFRGLRGSDQPLAATFPGLFTLNITNPTTYIYRSIIADCYRGLQYLAGRPDVDTGRMVAIGNDLALITAALSPTITHVVCTPILFHDTLNQASRTNAYPLQEINDYIRLYPSAKDAVYETLSFFDLRSFAPQISATTLIMGDADGELFDYDALKPLLDAFSGKTTLHKGEHSSYKDGLFSEQWMTSQFDLAKPILPEHWT